MLHATRAVAGASAAAGLIAVAATGCGSSGSAASADEPSSASGAAKARPVSAAQLARLPQATTFGTVRGAPVDPEPSASLDGTVLHPAKDTAVYDKPGGKPIAALPAKQLKGPTWVPVIAEKAGWRQVLLPSRPNHATGWLPGGGDVKEATSSYRIDVSLKQHRLTVTDGGRKAGSWPVAVGTGKNPTPTGRTFVLASLSPSHPTYSKLIFPLGTHSNSLDRFGGGPGTVALHGWPDQSVFGRDVSHGCVRMPQKALDTLASVPLGSPVQIV